MGINVEYAIELGEAPDGEVSYMVVQTFERGFDEVLGSGVASSFADAINEATDLLRVNVEETQAAK